MANVNTKTFHATIEREGEKEREREREKEQNHFCN